MPLFRGMKRWGVLLSVLLLSSLLLAACGENSPSVLDPKGPVAGQEAGLFWFVLVVATIVFVAVEGWLIFSIVRYRARPNTPEPRQIHGNNTVELIWTVLPSLFLFAVLAGTIYTMFGLQNVPGSGSLSVNVVGHQWWWEFDYPNQNIVTADTLYIPQGATINVSEYSNNVIHSFWIPKITGKTDDIPGHINTKVFRADTVGVYRGECTEYCGAQHANMNFSVVVLPASSWSTWVSSQQAAAQTPTDSNALQGQKVFTGAGGCAACHGIVGVNLNNFNDPNSANKIGPNLTHFGSRSLIAGGVIETTSDANGNPYSWANDPTCQLVNGTLANPTNCGLYRWLHDPQGEKPGNDMIIGSLTDTQIFQLIAYLQSLK